jgi:PhnB protein
MLKIEPYLSFEGRAEEAIEFYKKTLGAKVTMLMHFKDAPPGACAGGMAAPGDKVMHASLLIGDTNVMLSDGRCQGNATFQGVSLSLTAPSDAESERLFNALSEGGQVHVPMSNTFFASRFGIVADRFGVNWMVITAS